jgi:hypothetical protein
MVTSDLKSSHHAQAVSDWTGAPAAVELSDSTWSIHEIWPGPGSKLVGVSGVREYEAEVRRVFPSGRTLPFFPQITGKSSPTIWLSTSSGFGSPRGSFRLSPTGADCRRPGTYVLVIPEKALGSQRSRLRFPSARSGAVVSTWAPWRYM